MRRSRRSLLATVLFSLIAFFAHPQESAFPDAPPEIESARRARLERATQVDVACPLYRVEHPWRTDLYLMNMFAEPLTV